jgi:hypothetical protein
VGDILKAQMVDLLLKEPVGQIVAFNILASREKNLLSEKLLKNFLSYSLAAFTENKIANTEDLISQFEDVARGKRPINGSKKFFLFTCKRHAPSVTETSTVSNVIELGTLKRNILKDSITVSGHGALLSNPDPTDPAIEYAINELNTISDKYRFGAKLGGNPKRPLFWITPSIKKERLVAISAKCADRVRDRLGLIHYENNNALVEIQIPGNVILGHESARPTFIEAVSHSRFRVSPDTIKAKKRSAWGWTVDLAKFADQLPQIDGLPERVVKPIDCNEDIGLKFRPIGCTTSSRGNGLQDNDVAFVKRLSNGIYLDSLKQAILDYF